MPEPITMAALLASAASNPEIQNTLLGVGKAGLRTTGRIADYAARGLGNITQDVGGGIADILGGLGEQYLPQSFNNAGGWLRRQIARGGEGIGGLYNAALGTEPQQQMPGMQDMMAAMAGQMGQMGGMGGQMTPQEMLQQYYQQNIQEDQLGNQQQQLRDQYNQQLIPQLASRFGGTRNSAFQRFAAQGAGNLQRDLGALGEQSRLQRLGQIGQYLPGQQQLGLQERELGQRGTINDRENALRQLGAMGGFGQNQQQNQLDRIIQMINARGGLGNLAQGQGFQNLQVGGQAPWWQDLLAGGANAVGQGIAGGIGYGIGGPGGAAGAMRR